MTGEHGKCPARPWRSIADAPRDRVIWMADWSSDITLVGWMALDGVSGFFTHDGQYVDVELHGCADWDPIMEWAELSALYPPRQQAKLLADMTEDTCYHPAAMAQFAELLKKAR